MLRWRSIGQVHREHFAALGQASAQLDKIAVAVNVVSALKR